MTHFTIGLSADFKTDAAGRLEPVLAELIDPLPHVTVGYFSVSGSDAHGAYVTPEDIAPFDAALALGEPFTAQSFSGNDRLATIARWGVGYDRIDVEACTRAGVLLAIAVDAARRPVAEAVVTLALALAKCLPEKDRIVRTARWDLRGATVSIGLRGRAFGMVGMGNIGAEVFRLLAPFDLGRKLAADPYISPTVAAELGVELVDIETVFRESDFVSINAPLTPETRGMIDARLLGLMKPTAYLINTARGPIVNQDDLIAALQARHIAGAGLDVFTLEPLPAGHPLTTLDNVILAPHSLAWTDELFHDNSVDAIHNILDVLQGRAPKYTVNRPVIHEPKFQQKLQQLAARWAAATA